MFLRDFAFRLVTAGTPRGELIVETRRRAAAPRDALWMEVAAPFAPRSVPRAAAVERRVDRLGRRAEAAGRREDAGERLEPRRAWEENHSKDGEAKLLLEDCSPFTALFIPLDASRASSSRTIEHLHDGGSSSCTPSAC